MYKCIPFSLLVMYPVISKNPPSNIIFRTLLSSLIAFIYLILRDLPSKGSIGKRIFKLKIINSDTKELASLRQKFIRNIPLLLNWIELIVFISTNKRIGDKLAKTDVVEIV